MEKRLLIALLCLASVLLFVGVMPIHGEAEIYDSVIRLHVLANSDSQEDQALKLTVRDEILKVTSGLLSECDDRENARKILEANRPLLEETAQAAILQAGYDYPVEVELTRRYFTTRQYDTVTLPAGTYDAVRVTIGAGAGQHWWCVVYPPLCAGAATDRRTLSQVLDSSQEALVSGGDRYIVKFTVMEWLETLLHIFR